MLQRIYTRVSKPAARYSDRGSMAEHCSACRFFMSGGDCARVLGRVLPQGWCKYFSREAVQRWNPLWPMTGSGPPGASLTLDFMSTPGTLPPQITFTRASTATFFNAAGGMQTATANAPRWDYNPSTQALNGLLIEDARTNLLLNSATLGTQPVTVTAQAYTLSFYGTGTITKSGTASGALVGAGAFPQRVSQTFTPTAGTLTLTVTGSVLNAQLEGGAFPSSYIPTTAVAVTRAQDQCGISAANMAGWFASPGGSWMAEFIYLNPAPANARVIDQQGAPTGGGIGPIFVDATQHGGQYDGAAAVSSVNTLTANAISKVATTWAANTGNVCANGGAVASGAMTSGYAAIVPTGIFFMVGANAGNTDNSPGYIRRVSYWPRVLSNAELQSVTT